MQNPKIAILILNWNNFPDTKVCLDSLDLVSYKNYKVILVDNGSSDDSAELLRAQYPDVTFLELDSNKGFAGGNNVGIKYILEQNFPYILLLNNDTEVINGDFLKTLLQIIQKDESIGAIGPKVFQTDGKVEQTILPYPTIMNTIWNTMGLNKRDQDKKQAVDSVTGCCVLIRSQVIEDIGLLDENYFMYAEETEWFHRMGRSGWKVLYSPVESIIHKGASSSKKIENQKIYIERRANVIYTLVKGKQYIQAMLTAILMFLLLGFRIMFSIVGTRKENRNSYPPNMLSALIAAFRKKWKIAIRNEFASG